MTCFPLHGCHSQLVASVDSHSYIYYIAIWLYTVLTGYIASNKSSTIVSYNSYTAAQQLITRYMNRQPSCYSYTAQVQKQEHLKITISQLAKRVSCTLINVMESNHLHGWLILHQKLNLQATNYADILYMAKHAWGNLLQFSRFFTQL